jgi:hypothetical protein
LQQAHGRGHHKHVEQHASHEAAAWCHGMAAESL